MSLSLYCKILCDKTQYTTHTADHDFCIQVIRTDKYTHIYTHKKQKHKYVHMHTYMSMHVGMCSTTNYQFQYIFHIQSRYYYDHGILQVKTPGSI